MDECYTCLICDHQSYTDKDAQFHAENCLLSKLNHRVKELEASMPHGTLSCDLIDGEFTNGRRE